MLPILYFKIPIRQDLSVLLASLKLINQHAIELTGTCLSLSPEFWIKGLCHHTQSFKKIGFWCYVFISLTSVQRRTSALSSLHPFDIGSLLNLRFTFSGLSWKSAKNLPVFTFSAGWLYKVRHYFERRCLRKRKKGIREEKGREEKATYAGALCNHSTL